MYPIIDFLIVVWAILMLVKGINSMKKKEEEKPAEMPDPSEEVLLLRDIRDEINKKRLTLFPQYGPAYRSKDILGRSTGPFLMWIRPLR